MLTIKRQVPLSAYTTFRIGGPAKFFACVKDQFDALEAYEFSEQRGLPLFLLGGGSNILVSDRGFNGLVLRMVNKGIEVVSKNQNEILLKVASGESWDGVVKFAVHNGWWGIENLSHIPGSAGAIAVQNVGAYGQEASQVIDSVTVFNTHTKEIYSLSNQECDFSYRSSIFNGSAKGKFLIFYITLKLSKNGQPNLNYFDLREFFGKRKPTLEEVRQAIIKIRDKKFPFPSAPTKGNAGSFFKNLELKEDEFSDLKKRFETVFNRQVSEALAQKTFKTDDNKFKVPSAFLLDVCGLKNVQVGGARINERQPLVIVNASGKAKAREVLALAKLVRKTVFEKTGQQLPIEPELVGFSERELADFYHL